MKFRIVFIIYLIILIGCKKSEEKSKNKTVDPIQLSIDRHADSLLLDSKINSASIGVYKDGKKYTSHYGELDKGKGNRPTDKTIQLTQLKAMQQVLLL